MYKMIEVKESFLCPLYRETFYGSFPLVHEKVSALVLSDL